MYTVCQSLATQPTKVEKESTTEVTASATMCMAIINHLGFLGAEFLGCLSLVVGWESLASLGSCGLLDTPVLTLCWCDWIDPQFYSQEQVRHRGGVLVLCPNKLTNECLLQNEPRLFQRTCKTHHHNAECLTGFARSKVHTMPNVVICGWIYMYMQLYLLLSFAWVLCTCVHV